MSLTVVQTNNIPPGFKIAGKFPTVKKQTNGINMITALQALVAEAQAQFPTATHLLGTKVNSNNQGFCIAKGKPYLLVKK